VAGLTARVCGMVLGFGALVGPVPMAAQAMEPPSLQVEERSAEGKRAAQDLPLSSLVPFLAQPPLLCGGAAAAMVERFWGKRGVYAQEYQDLVNPDDGGIRYAALAEELRGRGWMVRVLRGVPEAASPLVDGGAPVIALLEFDPGRFHYVVLVGWSPDEVRFHDPAVGPNLSMEREEFLRRWSTSGYRGIVVLPTAGTIPSHPLVAGTIPSHPLGTGVQGETGNGDSLGLLQASRQAFDEGRYGSASALAETAAERDPRDQRAWRLLAASLYMQGRPLGALSSWNRARMPRVDLIQVHGASTVSHRSILGRIGLAHQEVLTPEGLQLAARRTALIPTVARARADYRPNADGSVEVHVHLFEEIPTWNAWTGVAGMLLQGLSGRRVRLHAPGLFGEGELIAVEGTLREARPGVGIQFSTPSTPLPGIATAGGAWGREVYAAGEPASSPSQRGQDSEEWTRVSLSLEEWVRPDTRAKATLLLERWQDRGRFLGLGASTFTFLSGSLAGLRMEGAGWVGAARQEGFAFGNTEVRWRGSEVPHGRIRVEVRSGVALASRHAPRALWPGAGTGAVRPYLLRAHPLTQGGAVREGDLGRGLWYGGGEVAGPNWRTGPIRLEPVGFVDLGRLWKTEGEERLRVDLGASARLRLMGTEGWLELSVARSLNDDASAVSLSWRETWWPR
jgi:hypothetical protein